MQHGEPADAGVEYGDRQRRVRCGRAHRSGSLPVRDFRRERSRPRRPLGALAVVRRLVSVDLLQGLGAVDRLDRIGGVDRLRGVGRVGVLGGLGGVGGLGALGSGTQLGDVGRTRGAILGSRGSASRTDRRRRSRNRGRRGCSSEPEPPCHTPATTGSRTPRADRACSAVPRDRRSDTASRTRPARSAS